ncbi:MAG: hypothetical protein M1816_000417 [Peltula sp. TS41687]|nr:MAG: hypothetical protein M1816_000417 [Peltula sp. TS41687]
MAMNVLHKRPYEDEDEQVEPKPKFIYRPVIGELLRTRYCAPNIVLLVAKIEEEAVPPPNDDRYAVRLYLIDGEYMIQGIIKEETYPFIESGETVEGSYIMLDQYELRKAPRRNGTGDTAFLAIAMFHTVGHDPEYNAASIMGGEGVSSSEEVAAKKDVSAEEAKPPPTKKSKLDSDESERVEPIEDEKSEFGGIDEDVIFDALDESLITVNASTSGKPRSVKDRVDVAGKTREFEITASLSGTDKNVTSRSTEVVNETSTCLVTSKENTSPEITNNATVDEDSSFTSISSSSSVNIATNADSSSAAKTTQPNNQLSMFKKPPAFIKTNTPTSAERITSTGRTLEFYELAIIAHYNLCHREAFRARKWFSDHIEKLPTRELTDPSAPETPVSRTAQMLLASHSLSQAALLAIERGQPLSPIYRPLDLRSLSCLKKTFPQQNLIIDVIALIDWVSPEKVERTTIGCKRELKLVDHTTDKKVLLSVFDDPENFTPTVGTVALFRNVRNHRWDGYSLNAYEKDCKGYDWFIPNPDWVHESLVNHLREWWVENRVEVRAVMGGVGDIVDKCPLECKHGYDRQEVNAAIAQQIWDEEGELRDWPNQ